ncbi:phage tail protein I [Iodobacter fluviatilis]|uniref:Bacteriophage P2-related tail formation protein n=1 Tax=Iodobacter fluviatilis TaxID=537 RepID=A0A377QAI7_9NEIS|nr:phage tail protein I [Iodobacter fluviatilis]TCU81212.1 phage tail P2-like protein [Iodobacter fluviatilis]STQ91728.1 Bacteriophage P2-related tail formation protein [Iodobacter fluviatilis]
MSLLPPNATLLELALSSACCLELDPSPMACLGAAKSCPVPFLPLLAWGASVEGWELATTEQMQRDLIANSLPTHRIKGTVGAVKGALAALNINVDLIEWWQTSPKGSPHSFSLMAWANENRDGGAPLSPETFQQIKTLVDELKPVRSYYELITGSQFNQSLALASTADLTTLSRFGADMKAAPLAFTQEMALASASCFFTLTRIAMEIQ